MMIEFRKSFGDFFFQALKLSLHKANLFHNHSQLKGISINSQISTERLRCGLLNPSSFWFAQSVFAMFR